MPITEIRRALWRHKHRAAGDTEVRKQRRITAEITARNKKNKHDKNIGWPVEGPDFCRPQKFSAVLDRQQRNYAVTKATTTTGARSTKQQDNRNQKHCGEDRFSSCKPF